MRTEVTTTMGQMEYENFVSMVNAMTDEQKWVVLRLLPSEMLCGEINARLAEQEKTIESIKNITRA